MTHVDMCKKDPWTYYNTKYENMYIAWLDLEVSSGYDCM